MSTVALPLDCRSCWQYLRKSELLPEGVYVVPLAEGQPRTTSAAAVVVGVLAVDVDDSVVVELMEEVEVEDAEYVDVDEVEDSVACVETDDDDEVEAGKGALELWAVDDLHERHVSLRL